MIRHEDVDLLVIGWGKAGKTLAGVMARAGWRVALVERSSSMYGGTCINIACVPTKDLIVSAEQRRESDDPASFFADAVAARDGLTARMRAANHAMLADKVLLVDGVARFSNPRTVTVKAGNEELTLTGRFVVVNTGSRPRPLDVPGAELALDSTTIQHIEPLPGRLAIIGGGFIAAEFAGMFAHFGSGVVVLGRGAFLPRLEPEIAVAAAEVLANQGVEVRTGVRVLGLRREGHEFVVSTETGEVRADAVLNATGRAPATAGLDLHRAGVATDERGFVLVDGHLRTSAEGVFAVGDVNGGPQFTYISWDDHRIVADQLLGEGRRHTGDRTAVPTVTFLTPPLAHVGMSKAEALASGRRLLAATVKVSDVAVAPRPKIVGRPEGLVSFVVDADSDEILGATLFCVDAQELINLVSLAMRTGATAQMLRDGIWTHPSSTELISGALAALEPLIG